MEPALDVLNRSLRGDPGARSFLDRTSSIYVLDATDLSKPKTYGSWNFIHQAINEVERAEASSPSNKLFPHVQLLSNMALRVARRSNDLDKLLVATCINNASKYHGSASEAQKLIEINVEIRDIVMGRIAAIALDPSFHKDGSSSAFSDSVVMEVFCAVLAANAVSNGPAAVNHLVSEWILPSAVNLPPFCLSCVILHLALEASRKSAPAGTQDMLQQISGVVMAGVLAPVLNESIKESNSNTERTGGITFHERNSRIAGLSLKAIDHWCATTDLSLAQIRHVCNKVQINIVDILSDAMYSDSSLVVDALADFIESVVDRQQNPAVTEERMTQVRYIMQVDEAAFRSTITREQLVLIESKEMASILEELVSAIGLQRFRFTDRQSKGDDDVCRNLARIAASICSACAKLSSEGRQLNTGPGLLDLLIKSASHPSLNICAIAIDVIGKLVSAENELYNQLLPLLQRRAITPHHVTNGNLSLQASDLCGVDYHEFQSFRRTVLQDALSACLKGNEQSYIASCTAAIEEFCSATSSVQVSFHLEAALYCIAAVSEEVISGTMDFTSEFDFLGRCIISLSARPASLSGNPLTLAQASIFLQKYGKCFGRSQGSNALELATDLALYTFNLCASKFPDQPSSIEMWREAKVSPYSEAAKALKALLCQCPTNFISNQALAALGAGWEASYSAANNRGLLTTEDRKEFCIGICHVLASLPDNQRSKSLLALAMPTLDCLETMLQHANQVASVSQEQLKIILERIAGEIIVVTTMTRTFSDAILVINGDTSMESGCRTCDGRAAIDGSSLPILKRAWTSITQVASKYNYYECIANALGYFMTKCIPPDFNTNSAVEFVEELCTIASSIVESDSSNATNFEPVLKFLEAFVTRHGDLLDQSTRSALQGQSSGIEQEIGSCVESLVLSTVDSISHLLGSTWTSQRQGNGQPAFETKETPESPSRKKQSNRALSSMFCFLQVCAERCPIFLLRLPPGPAQDRNEDLLLRRAVEASMPSILESDVDTSSGAIQLLEATVILTESFSNDIRDVAEEIISRVRSHIVTGLVIGSCGKLNSGVLDDAARLLRRILIASPSSEENRANIMQSISNEHIFLGSTGKEVALHFLFRTSRNDNTDEDVSEFFNDIWELHQIETLESLKSSDALVHFCKKYTQS